MELRRIAFEHNGLASIYIFGGPRGVEKVFMDVGSVILARQLFRARGIPPREYDDALWRVAEAAVHLGLPKRDYADIGPVRATTGAVGPLVDHLTGAR